MLWQGSGSLLAHPLRLCLAGRKGLPRIDVPSTIRVLPAPMDSHLPAPRSMASASITPLLHAPFFGPPPRSFSRTTGFRTQPHHMKSPLATAPSQIRHHVLRIPHSPRIIAASLALVVFL